MGKVVQWFHAAGVATVVLSSTALGADGELLCLASTVRGQGQQVGFYTFNEAYCNINLLIFVFFSWVCAI